MSIETKVSVIIPCYNNKATIIETLNSVFNQTYKNIEIILVDDGSTEDIENEVASHIVSNELLFFQQKNQGVSHARNFGASKSTGEYLIFLDADDIIDETYIEKCLKEFENNSNVKIVYSQAKLFGREDKIWEIDNYKNFKSFLIGNCIFVSAMLRKRDFDKVGGFDCNLNFYEDWDLWVSILKDGGEVAQIKEYLFYYRTHENLSSASDKALNLKKIHAFNRLKIYFKHYDAYETEFTHFEQIFLTYIDSITPKPKKKKWYAIFK